MINEIKKEYPARTICVVATELHPKFTYRVGEIGIRQTPFISDCGKISGIFSSVEGIFVPEDRLAWSSDAPSTEALASELGINTRPSTFNIKRVLEVLQITISARDKFELQTVRRFIEDHLDTQGAEIDEVLH